MYHSITFITSGPWHPTRAQQREISYNTWEDWHLIPTSAPVIAAPSVNTYYTENPLADGEFDFTELLVNGPTFGFREGSMEFLVDNGHKPWYALYSEIMDVLHGQFVRAVLEDERYFYYDGRFTVNKWVSGEHWSTITLDYKLNPEKHVLEV